MLLYSKKLFHKYFFALLTNTNIVDVCLPSSIAFAYMLALHDSVLKAFLGCSFREDKA